MTTILKRLLELIPTLIGVSVLTFVLMRMTPGDPVKLMLGPEATEESITAKRVELGFQKYLPGIETTAVVINLNNERLYLAVELPPESGSSFAIGDSARIHLADEINPLSGEVVEAGDLAERIDSGQTLVALDHFREGYDDGRKIEVGINRVLADRSVVVQYLSWIGSVLAGNMGQSITSERPVTEEIFTRLPNTILLALVAMCFAVITGLLVGTLSAVYPRTLLDNLSRIFVFVFLAMPSFWLGLELIIIFSRNLKLFPPAGIGHVGHVVLPALTLGIGTGAFLSRILRSSMLQVLNMDYVRTARAKGLHEIVVILKHSLKNALIPFVTVAGLSLGALLGGSVIVESIFNWPGVGKLLIDSIKERDFPVTMGCVLVLATVFVTVNLVVDLLYVLLDPRIRLEGGNET